MHALIQYVQYHAKAAAMTVSLVGLAALVSGCVGPLAPKKSEHVVWWPETAVMSGPGSYKDNQAYYAVLDNPDTSFRRGLWVVNYNEACPSGLFNRRNQDARKEPLHRQQAHGEWDDNKFLLKECPYDP